MNSGRCHCQAESTAPDTIHPHPIFNPPPSRTDGVDIDPVLAGKAVAAAARLREELQRRMRDATSPAKK
jgi:hypothetical protein